MRVVRWKNVATGVESFTIIATGIYFPVGKTDSSFKLKLSMAAGGQTASVDTVRDSSGSRTGYGAMNVSGTTETKLGSVISFATGIIVTAISGTLNAILDDEIPVTNFPEMGLGRFPAKEDADAYVYGATVPQGLPAIISGTQYTYGGAGVGWVQTSGGKNPLRWFANRKLQGSLDVMSTPPTVTSGASATLLTELDGTAVISGMRSGLSRVSRFGLIRPYSGGAPGSTSYDGTRGVGAGDMPGGNPVTGSGFVGMIHYGQNIEFKFWTNTDGVGAYSRVMFGVDEGDGIKWVSKTATYLTPESGNVFYKLAFSSVKKRTIYVAGASRLSAIYGDANDSLIPAPRVGPRTLIVSDSFGGPTAMTTVNNGYFAYPRYFANTLGMNDVISSSLGGSSWQSSDYRKITLRIDYDIAPAKPEVIIFALGRNDNGGLNKSVVDAGLDYCKLKCPDAKIIVIGMMWDNGPEYWTTGNLEAYNAIKDSALERDLPYIDTMQIPPGTGSGGWITGSTLVATANAGATSITVTKPLASGMAIVVNGEICYVTAVSGVTCTLSKALTASQSSGSAISILGIPLVTGNGYNYTGTGSAARFFGADNTHPTDEGNIMYGEYYAQAIVEYCTREFA